MNVFESKILKPMLIGAESEPFDSEEYIFELKFDGIRCLAYIDENSVTLRNKNNVDCTELFPELSKLFIQVKQRCVLDGEIIILRNGKPNFFELQKRLHLKDEFKIELAAKIFPVSYTVFDIVFLGERFITEFTIMERKKILLDNVYENQRLAVSRYISEYGIDFFELTKNKELEGIIAKHKDSRYFFDRSAKDWIKIKNQLSDYFIICGYLLGEKNTARILLAQYKSGRLRYSGRVSVQQKSDDFSKIERLKKTAPHFEKIPIGCENAIWTEIKLVCIVSYNEKTAKGNLRHPVYKKLRPDKLASECIDSTE